MSKSKVGIALWGCGHWGEKWLRTLASNPAVDLIHVVDTSAERLVDLAGNYQELRFSKDHQTTLDDSRVQAVIIAAPVKDHAQLTILALKANRYVLCEKPLCQNLDEFRKITDTAKESRGKLMVGHLLAFYPLLQMLQQVLVEGKLGRLRGLEFRRTALGRVRRVEDVVQSFAVHDLVAAMLLNPSPIHEVWAHGWGLTENRIEEAHLILKSEAIICHIYINWLCPYKERRILVTSEKGSAEFLEDIGGTHLKVWQFDWDEPQQNEDTIPLKASLLVEEDLAVAALDLELQGFIDLIQIGTMTPGTDLEFTGQLMKIVDNVKRQLSG